MKTRALGLAGLILALAGTTAHAASDEDYALSCTRELLANGRSTKSLPMPVAVQVAFTGSERNVRDPQGDGHIVFEDLTILIDGKPMKGGRFKGSTYEASTTYDGTFERNMRGTVEWAFSRGLNAFTVTTGGRTLVCKLK